LVSGVGEAGQAAARTLARLGFDLVLVDNCRDRLTALGAELNAKALCCDVASETGVLILGAELERIGPVDLLINAAGASYVRMLGMLRVSQAVAGRMRGGGRQRFIVNIAGRHVPGDLFAFASSDVAFRRMSAALGESLRASGVEVSICQAETSLEIVTRLAERLRMNWPSARPSGKSERAA
jgi:short-subunit dehydrogenase